MTNKELKRLRRRDLLELMLGLSEQLDEAEEKLKAAEETIEKQKEILARNDALAEQLEDCRMQIEELEQKQREEKEHFETRSLEMKKIGSIAEAALALNGVFEAAQKAADQYVESVRHSAMLAENSLKKREQEANEKAEQIIREAKEKAEAMRDEPEGE